MSTDRYTSPLSERYASKEMQYIFSQDKKFRTWRKLWIALAETEMELGLSENGKPVITQEQIDELKAHAEDINYDVAREREKLVRHDVMSHVYAYGQQCPKAAGIIHLGATSCYVGDNTDIILMREALELVHKKLVNVIAELAKFADTYKNLPTLAFTHFQPAQPTTVGKRATLWAQEFIMDLEDLEYVMGSLKLLGSKGTTGTQASFLELFDGDQETIDKIDPMIAAKMGFKECYAVSGQTYSRKVDTRVANILAGIAASAHKFSNDIRLLQHLKEIEEPFEDDFTEILGCNNDDIKEGVIEEIIKPYVKNLVHNDRILSQRDKIGEFIDKIFNKGKNQDELIEEYKQILREVSTMGEEKVCNTANYILNMRIFLKIHLTITE